MNVEGYAMIRNKDLFAAFGIALAFPIFANAGVINFTVVNESVNARYEVVRVSLPIQKGVAAGVPANWLIVDNKPMVAQTRVITRYPDSSPRRVMLSFLAHLQAHRKLSCQYDPGAVLPDDSPLKLLNDSTFCKEKGNHHIVFTPHYTLRMRDDCITFVNNLDDRILATVEAYGPELSDPQLAKTTLIEVGPFFVWLRWAQHGSNYSREVDFQVDRLGHIKLTQRILRHMPGNEWTPDFGFRLTGLKAKPIRVPANAVHFLQFSPDSAFGEHPELVASMKLANGTPLSMANALALRQNCGTLEAEGKSEEVIALQVSRIEQIEDEGNKLMIQEGMWRVIEVVLLPDDCDTLAARIDQPLATHVDWRAYDVVYHTGAPLQTQHPLLKELSEHALCVLAKMSINGDDWGNVTSYNPVTDKPAINSMLRFNHCQYVWEDYFRTSDCQLRRVALNWSENYRNFSIYWGPVQKYHGGSRRGQANRDLPGSPHGPGTCMVRSNNAVHFCTKGYHNFWLTYEETGDPRFKEAAEIQARWSSEHVHANTGEMRNVGMITDYTKLYHYTDDSFYLDQALRLWEEFKSRQCPDLLFTQHGGPATGNDLFIRDDEYGYRHPFYKAYMVQYATNSLPCLLKHRPGDQRIRDTIIACNNWMTKVQKPGGGWSYPGPTSPGLHWAIEYCHGLLLGHEITPNEAYLDAVQRTLRTVVALYEKYGSLPSSIAGWEITQNQPDLLKTYKLGIDRDHLKDFTHGKVQFGTTPDNVVYLQVVLRDYLRYRDEASLLSKDQFVEQIIRLPSNLPRDRVRSERQHGSDRIIYCPTQKSIRE